MARRRSLGDRLSLTPLLAVAVCLLAPGFASAVPAADGPRAAATPAARLFTQSSARATLTPTKCECDGRSILTLRGVSKRTARFSDHPKRHAGLIGTRSFTRAWSRYGFSAEAPSAALDAIDASGRRRSAVFELTDPRYDAKRRTLRYRARAVPFQTGPLKLEPRAGAVIPARLRRVSLFIAKGNAPVIDGCLLAFAMRCNGPDLRRAALPGIDLRYAGLPRARMANANLAGARMRAIRLFDADLSAARLMRTDLSRANLGAAQLRRADLSDADLRHAELSGADLSGTRLVDAKVSDARLVDVDLSFALLSRADLTGADLSGARLSGASLEGAVMTGAELTDAVYCHTVMPDTRVNNSGC